MKNDQIVKLKGLLKTKRNIVITTHRSPDGDAIGSSLALYNYLIMKGHCVNVITPNDYPLFLHWLKGDEKVIQFENDNKIAKSLTENAEIIFCLDFNNLSRLDSYGHCLSQSKSIKVLIDHHEDPANFDIMFSNSSVSSTAELIFKLIDKLGDLDCINTDIAECLYVGIMTDTGNFRFPSVTFQTHEIVSFLLKKNVDHSKAYDLIYDNNSENRLKLLGYCLNKKIEVLSNYKAAIITLTNDELDKFHYQKGDTEGIVNYALSLKGIFVAALFIEYNGIVKISFRSKGDIFVNDLAKKYFNGGGHINAAGGICKNIEDGVKIFKNVVKNYV